MGVPALAEDHRRRTSLPVANGDVVDDRVARDHGPGISRSDAPATPPDDEGELALVVDCGGRARDVDVPSRPVDAGDLLVEDGRERREFLARLGSVIGVVQADGEELARLGHRRQERLLGQCDPSVAGVDGAAGRLPRRLTGGQEPAHAPRQVGRRDAQIDDRFLVREHADRGTAVTADRVGHRRPARRRGELDLVDHIAGLLVVRPQDGDFPAPRAAGQPRRATLGLEEQRLRQQRSGRGRTAERTRILAGQLRDLLPRAVAKRLHPGVLAGVQVDRRESAVGRPCQRQALRSLQGEVVNARHAAYVPEVGTGAVRLDQPDDHRHGEGGDVDRRRLGIDRGAVPVRAATPAGQQQGPLERRRREQRTGNVLVPDLLGRFVEFRREGDQHVVALEALMLVGRRLRRERLGRRRPLARNVGLRHRPLLDRPDGLAGRAVEDVDEALLRRLGDRLDLFAVDGYVDQVRRRRHVVVPQPVVDELEVPHLLAGRRVEADQALGAAVPVVRRRAGGQVDVAEFRVAAHHGPDVRVATVRPGFVLPRLYPRFVPLGNRVEDPLLFAGTDVESADVPRRHLLPGRAIEDRGTDDDRVADDHRRRNDRVDPALHRPPEPDRQVDLASFAEVSDRLARVGVDGPEVRLVRRHEDPRLLAVRPVADAAVVVAEVRGPALPPVLRVEHPLLFAGLPVDRGHLAERRRRVKHTADHERGHLVGARPEHPVPLGGLGVVRGIPAPDDLEFGDVVPVDLVERGVLRAAVVAAVGRPVAGADAVLGRGRYRPDDQQRRHQRRCHESSL